LAPFAALVRIDIMKPDVRLSSHSTAEPPVTAQS